MTLTHGKSLAIVAMLAGWIGLSTLVARAQEPSYIAGKAAWEAGEYALARELLLAYRATPYGRLPAVDYMLGTAGCRILEFWEWGYAVLDWMLYAYALTADSRLRVATERNLCRNAIVSANISAKPTQIIEERSAGMTASGKTFFWVGRNNDILSYPIHQKRQIELTELLARRIPRGHSEEAANLAQQLVPKGTHLTREQLILTSTAGHDRRTLGNIAQRLEHYISFLEAAYAVRTPPYYLHVYLTRDTNEVHQLADRLHGLDVSLTTLGYAYVDDASVVGVVPDTDPGTIRHELFHLLVRAGFGDIPQWLDEGIASLYEVADSDEKGYSGLSNWRGKVLSALQDLRPTIRNLIRSEWFLFDDPQQGRAFEQFGRYDEFQDSPEARQQAAMMATARYFALYLERRGELVPVFQAVRDQTFTNLRGDARDRTVGIVESVLKRKIDIVERDFVAWLEGQHIRTR